MAQLQQPIKWHGNDLKSIPGFPGYAVDTRGHIWSAYQFRGAGYAGKCGHVISDKWKRLHPDVRPSDGRKRYTLKSASGGYVRKYGSYFVLLAHHGGRPSGMEACHNDGDCTNDAPSNLRWNTSKANKRDMAAHGTRQLGQSINTAKLTPGDVVAIRKRRAGGESLADLAQHYSVTKANVSYICQRKTWRHI